MMPRNTPLAVPPHLRGDAGPDTLAALVADGRALGRFWPSAPAAEAAREPGHGPGFRVPAGSAALLGAWLDREG